MFNSGTAKEKDDKEVFVYFGTFARKSGEGIYVSRLNPATGNLSAPQLAVEIASPGFLALHPSRPFLYAVGELVSAEKNDGAVNAFAMDRATGQLTFLNQQSSGGQGPCHLVVDKSGRWVLVANYAGGSVSVLPIQDGGQLGKLTEFIQHIGSSVNPQRQKEAHAHSINVDSSNRFAIVADLGMDKVMIYKFDPAAGKLLAHNPSCASVKQGAGPRHFAFHPNGRSAYVINEIDCSVTAFDYDKTRGELKETQTISLLPGGEKVKAGFSSAEIQVHPSGKFLYGSTRGHDSITVFAIDKKTGALTYVQNESTQGKVPRNFGIDPTGQFLLAANQDSDGVVVFRIDAKSGQLTPTGQKIEVPSPVCVKFLPVSSNAK